jgi:predicted DNA-binding transcriptional regulator AlpA
MKRMAISLIFALTLVWFASFRVSAEKQLFSLTVEAPSEPLKVGGELRLRVTVTNTSDRSITFIRSPGIIPHEAIRYNIEVRDSRGESAPPSEYVRKLKTSETRWFESSHAYTIKPGESFVDDVEVTRFYDLSQPGKYTISVAREFPPRQKLGEGAVKSNSIDVTVVP